MITNRTAPPEDHLRQVGSAIYGEDFRSLLSEALEIDARTLRRWLSREIELAWSHGVIADARELLRAEHQKAIERERLLRTVLADLDDAIEYRRKCDEYGGEERYSWVVGDPPRRPTTEQDHVHEQGRLQAEISKRDRIIRDLETKLHDAKRPNGMSFDTGLGVQQTKNKQ